MREFHDSRIAAETAALDANAVRFSQGTVSFTKVRPGGAYTYDDIVQSMSSSFATIWPW